MKKPLELPKGYEKLMFFQQRSQQAPAWEAKALEELARALAEELAWKPGDLFMSLRVAVTCRKVSTPLFETMEILGREECLARMDEATEKTCGSG